MMGLAAAMGTQEEEVEAGADELAAEVPVAPPAAVRLGRRLTLLFGRFPRATRQSSQSHTYGFSKKSLLKQNV